MACSPCPPAWPRPGEGDTAGADDSDRRQRKLPGHVVSVDPGVPMSSTATSAFKRSAAPRSTRFTILGMDGTFLPSLFRQEGQHLEHVHVLVGQTEYGAPRSRRKPRTSSRDREKAPSGSSRCSSDHDEDVALPSACASHVDAAGMQGGRTSHQRGTDPKPPRPLARTMGLPGGRSRTICC